MNLISYCNGSWPSIGGVARYDTQLKLIFPNRIFFKGPQEKDKMLNYLKNCDKPIIITDNHLACDVPNEYPILLVHHGCALTTAERNPDWDSYWRDLCCNGQKQMLSYRNTHNTWIISTAESCTYDFNRFYPDLYPKFKRIDLIHTSELNENNFKKSFNDKPVILGNWNHAKKGKHLLPKLKELLSEFEFVQLKVIPENSETLESFNKRKQDIYLNSDMYLMISNSEAGPYTSIDAMNSGLVNISTNIGIFEFDVDKDAYVELKWEKCYGENIDYEYLCNKIRYAWDNKKELSRKGREWYMKNCRFNDWKIKMKKVVNDFYNHIYNN